MKKDNKIAIRNKAWKMAWDENKDEHTMQEMADIFGASLATFFRAVKVESETKKKN